MKTDEDRHPLDNMFGIVLLALAGIGLVLALFYVSGASNPPGARGESSRQPRCYEMQRSDGAWTTVCEGR